MYTIIDDSNIRNLLNKYLGNRLPYDLRNIPIGDWDVSRVTDMNDLFEDIPEFNEPLNNWNVSNVTNMRGMFNGCSDFNQDLNNWDVSKVTNMEYMFFQSERFNKPLNNWNVGNVTNMGNMFVDCERFDQPLNNWKVHNVTNMEAMFFNCRRFDQPLNNWNVSKVTNMAEMFGDCKRFDQPLNNWKLNRNGEFTDMFKDCPIAESNKPQLPVQTPPSQSVVDVENKFKIIPKNVEVYDAIMMESTAIDDFIKEDEDNLVFVCERNYFGLSKSTISTQIQNKSNIVYECLVADTMRQDYIIKNKPCLSLKSIGIFVADFVNMKFIDVILNSKHQIYELVKTDKKFVSTVSHAVLFDQGTYVGARHCQAGQGGIVYDVVKVHKGPKKSRKNIPSLPKTRKSRSRSKSKSHSKTKTRRSRLSNKTKQHLVSSSI